MMYTLSEAMKNEIVNQLNEICADSTNIMLSKYEVFTAARNKVNDIVNYRNVRNEVRDIVENFLAANAYNYITRWNGKFTEYFITTEDNEVTVSKGSRGRILIPKNIVETAGLKAGDTAVFEIYATADYDEYFYLYDLSDRILDSKLVNYCGTIQYTVEKNGGIRMTVHPLNDTVTVKAAAGWISVE